MGLGQPKGPRVVCAKHGGVTWKSCCFKDKNHRGNFRCRALTPCDKAPDEDWCQRDGAVAKMNDALETLYSSGVGTVTKELYCKAYESVRGSAKLPHPFTGDGGPLAPFKGGACPIVQWPSTAVDPKEPFWPHNGYPQNPVWKPVWEDFFGNEFRNLYVYTGS